jgi:hypothetical protein
MLYLTPYASPPICAAADPIDRATILDLLITLELAIISCAAADITAIAQSGAANAAGANLAGQAALSTGATGRNARLT